MTQRMTHGISFTKCPECLMPVGSRGLARHREQAHDVAPAAGRRQAAARSRARKMVRHYGTPAAALAALAQIGTAEAGANEAETAMVRTALQALVVGRPPSASQVLGEEGGHHYDEHEPPDHRGDSAVSGADVPVGAEGGVCSAGARSSASACDAGIRPSTTTYVSSSHGCTWPVCSWCQMPQSARPVVPRSLTA
jgi:hypothetical protein